ncbi:YjbQ family protein [bacterium]|nr:MAG: YjbQ family protein [bacterium]
MRARSHFRVSDAIKILLLHRKMTYQETINLETTTQFEIIDVTKQVEAAVAKSKIKSGIAVVYSPHTTATIQINHNEPLLKQDIMKMLYRIAPIDINYAHDFFEIRTQVKAGERSNGHAHVKAFMLGASQSIPLDKGRLNLGERQSVFFVELDGGRKRRVLITILGD